MSWWTKLMIVVGASLFSIAVVAGTLVYTNMAVSSLVRIEKLEEAILEIKDLNIVYGTEQVLQAQGLRELQAKLAEMLIIKEKFVYPKNQMRESDGK